MLFIVLILLIILYAAVFDVLQYVVMRGGGGHWHCFHILGLIQSSFNRHTAPCVPTPTYCHYSDLRIFQRYRQIVLLCTYVDIR